MPGAQKEPATKAGKFVLGGVAGLFCPNYLTAP